MIFLVDFENVHITGLYGIETLQETDKLYIFYSENAKINAKTFELLAKVPCPYILVEAECGSANALDFQLSTFLGSLIKIYDKFCLVTNDTGYDAVVRFWCKRKIFVVRSSDLTGRIIPQPQNRPKALRLSLPEQEKKNIAKQVYMLCDGVRGANLKDIVDIIISNDDKEKIRVGLQKAYKDSKLAAAVFKRLKDVIEARTA